MPRYYKYEQREKVKKSLLMIVIFFVLFFGSLYTYRYFNDRQQKSAEGIFTVCALNHKDTINKIKSEDFTEVYLVNDYLYYGETLNLFHEKYDIKNKDNIIGRTLILTNLCTGDEMVYLLNGFIDSQIPVESLDDGFYSVKVVSDMIQRRAYSDHLIDDVFYTIRRNGMSKEVRLIADKDLFSNEQYPDVLDRNYLYIEISTKPTPDDVYDIVLDPGHNSRDNGDYIEVGAKANGMIEAEETYKLAMVIKDELEKMGLKVLVTRNESGEVVNTYGENGRLDRAYQSQAKYYLDLQMRAANSPKTGGSQIVYSSFSSNKMATALFNYVIENTDLRSTGYSGAGKISGVIPSGKINGYDGRMVIRESGGRILAAGTFSEMAIAENASFALDAVHGLQTFTFEYIYLTNPDEALNWQENYRLYGVKTAEALVNFLRINE